MSHKNTPHYKTLDIITFYNQVYDFVSRYLIFVIAGILSLISITIIWFLEPNNNLTPLSLSSNDKPFIQETGLIYPVNYFAQKAIILDADNKIYGLGGPIWRTQGVNKSTRNSIDNIVQFNGVILPRQLGQSSWVPKLQQLYYSEGMIKIFIEGMGTSQVNINSISSSLTHSKKNILDSSLFETFNIGCTSRKLFTTKFCDLKLFDAIPLWSSYDLSGSIEELQFVHDYVFSSSTNKDIKSQFCDAMIKQYRYSGSLSIAKLADSCSKVITDEIHIITDMIAINTEVKNNKFTNVVYNSPIINYYKLMSWYQYFMTKIPSKEFTDGVDDIILANYESYITKLISKTAISQPYGDIISVFHQQYLIPWLNDRESFASTAQKELTQKIITTTDLIINGNSEQGISSVTSGSRIKPVDFLISQGMYYDNSGTTGNANIIPSYTSGTNDNPIGQSQDTPPTQDTGATIIPNPTVNTQNNTIDELVASVLGTKPSSITKKGSIIIIKYIYQGQSWFATVDMNQGGITQLYYDSPLSGATKISHEQFNFNTSATKIIRTIMDGYLSKNPQ